MSDAPYIVFEGIDGTGKSTQARLLANWLLCHFEQVRKVKEPYDPSTPIHASRMMTPDAKSLVYEADRTNRESLLGGEWAVVQDRSYFSTIAYQWPSVEVGDWIILRERPRKPDAVILLDAPAHALRARLEGRGALDAYEYDQELQEVVRARYKALDGTTCNWYTFDALQPVGALHDDIVNTLEDVLELNGLAWC